MAKKKTKAERELEQLRKRRYELRSKYTPDPEMERWFREQEGRLLPLVSQKSPLAG